MKVLVWGLGLIGGSFAKAIRNSSFIEDIYGYDTSEFTLKYAKSQGIIDNLFSLEDSFSEIDLLVIASPLDTYQMVFENIRDKVTKSDLLVMDLGSVKKYPEDLFEEVLGDKHIFIGGHPMAGSDKSGIENSSGTLFENAVFFLTNLEKANENGKIIAQNIVRALGSEIVEIDSDSHDRIVSKVSHIPHIMASLLVNNIDDGESIKFAGSGFRDTTRIASGNPNLWKDIISNNKNHIVSEIDNMIDSLKGIKSTLVGNNLMNLVDLLEKGKRVRKELPEHLRDNMNPLYDIIIDVKDRPGVLGEVTTLLGIVKANIKQIEILNSREGYHGALRICFSNIEDLEKAQSVLEFTNYEQVRI
ncbi:MAG: prephenate dehydrogenase [Firmicutes bacterium]|jgi:prephenate dehydrogenase|nr:prephenate dehydrogenase [Bacillota bacterium]